MCNCNHTCVKLQVVIPGYCVAGTVGHKVLSGQKKIELDKKSVVSYETFAKFAPHHHFYHFNLPHY